VGAALHRQVGNGILFIRPGELLAGGAAILVDHNADHFDARIGLELYQRNGHGGRFT